jgi:peroxiredoxin
MNDEYNTPEFRVVRQGYESVDFEPSLRVGMVAPDFALSDTEGRVVRLSEETAKNHVVLIFGCLTSPVTATHLPEINRMWEYFHWRGVEFLFIYTREIHPGERRPHFTSEEQKLQAARELLQLEEVRFPVLVDALDGTVHRTYGARPNPSFVVNRDGRLVYRTPSVDPPTLREYLTHLLLWDEVRAREIPAHFVYTEELRFQIPDSQMHRKVLERAGPKAVQEQENAHGGNIAGSVPNTA